MTRIFRLAGLGLLAALGACASIGSGTSQQIVVNTDPPGAMCGLYREGFRIAAVTPTPGAATVQKTKHDITIICLLPGHQQAELRNNSGAEAMTFGNLIIGGGIGWAIDSASGADNKYDSPVNIRLLPLQPGSSEVRELPANVPVTPRPRAAPAQ
jgi:hypothetical protein